MLGFKEFFDDQGYSNEQLINLYLHNSDKSIKEITRLTGKTIGELYRVLHAYNIKPNRLKINNQNVIDFANSGMPVNQIAELTGYSARNVRYILEREKNGRNRN